MAFTGWGGVRAYFPPAYLPKSNFAQQMLAQQQLNISQQAADREDRRLNMAAEQMSHKRKMAEAEFTAEQRKEVLDFTHNMLVGVKGQEDLDAFYQVLGARYPDEVNDVYSILGPTYTPQTGETIEAMGNALRSESDKIKREGMAQKGEIHREKMAMEQKKLDKPKDPKTYAPQWDIIEDKEGNQKYIQRGRKIPEGWRKAGGKGRITRINPDTGEVEIIEGADVTTGAKTKAEKDIMRMSELYAEGLRLKKLYKKEYLTLKGKVKRWTLRALNFTELKKLTPEEEEYLAGARDFFETVESIFHRVRHDITGAQAVMKEINTLRRSVLNANLVSAEFESSYNKYMGKLKLAMRLKLMYIRQGLRGAALKHMMNKSWKLGEDVTPEEIDARGDELEKELQEEGLTDPDELDSAVERQLIEEGYL